MQEDIERIKQKLLEALEDLQKCVEGALKDALKSAGFDASALSGLMGKAPGFDPYAVLDLDKSASDEEIKKRYHELLHKLHPDTAGVEGTSFLLQMVLAAYEIIKKERGWK